MTYFVKLPAKFRRSKSARLAPVWTFSSEVEAIDFAKSFESCWVDVVFEGKVIFSNYSQQKPKWVSEAEATVIHQQNLAIHDDMALESGRLRSKKRGAM